MNDNTSTPTSDARACLDDQLVDQTAVQEHALDQALVSARFGIAEWYGHSFVDLSPQDRSEFATFKPRKDTRMTKADRIRLEALRKRQNSKVILSTDEQIKLASLEERVRNGKLSRAELRTLSKLEAKLYRNKPLSEKEEIRFDALVAKEFAERAGNKLCPFKTGDVQTICTKDGGVCSLRLYQQIGGRVVPVSDINPEGQGGIRATCPSRFHEKRMVFEWASRELLNQENPNLAVEVGFLESEGTVDADEGEDVGRIDMILVDANKAPDHPMSWAALEVQAVYFSGEKMGIEFNAIAADVAGGGTGLIWPIKARRPDYRSCGPKRLMPQLQIKVPTLRRWGKKMAVVVDRSFYNSMGKMKTVEHASNSDIAWFIVDFKRLGEDPSMAITLGKVIYTTLEEAVSGLTGGKPVSKEQFELRIIHNLAGKFNKAKL
jgi:hypothetical protein